jgi:hypothetical protein
MTFKIDLDTTDLLEAADRLAVLDVQTLREIREATVDAVSLSVRKAAVAETVKQLNLTPAYVDERISRKRGKREVSLTQDLVISPVRGTTLQRFGSGIKQETKPVKYTNADIMAITRKYGFQGGVAMGSGKARPYAIGPKATLPNGVVSKIWTQRMGDPSRGIPADRKADGISVDVNRKGMKRIASAFTLPLRNNNGTGVFRREKGEIKHLYGPSVFQVFRRYAREKEADIMAELQDSFLLKLDAQLSKI